MSCLSNPFEVSIDDILIILGPRLPDPEPQDEDSKVMMDDDSYDENNCQNIYGNEVKLPEKRDFP